jgi:hypothetical protein
MTELQVLDDAFLVGDVAPPGIGIGDITDTGFFNSYQFGLSYSLPVFGK